MVSGDAVDSDQSTSGPPAASPEQGGDSFGRQDPQGVMGEVSFPVSMRGYDRGAVDAYVDQVQRLVGELEATRSPEAAVRHALAQVGEQTRGILERAGEAAEQITIAARQEGEESSARAKSEAEDIVAKAKAEAAEIGARSNAEAESTEAQARKHAAEYLQRAREEVTALREEAEARLRELHADTETIRQERGQLLGDLRALAGRVGEVASAAEARLPPEAGELVTEGGRESEAASQADPTDVRATQPPTAEAGVRRDSPP